MDNFPSGLTAGNISSPSWVMMKLWNLLFRKSLVIFYLTSSFPALSTSTPESPNGENKGKQQFLSKFQKTCRVFTVGALQCRDTACRVSTGSPTSQKAEGIF